MRNRRLALNTITSTIYEITSIAYGLILPQFLLSYFGSEVNGLVNSINQFLGIITFLQLGMGAIVRSALYKPLAEKDDQQISRILSSANKFFRKIAYILLIYVFVLMVVYPYIAEQSFGHIYIAGLIAVLSISSFAQYYFGIVDAIILQADQKGYIQYLILIVSQLLNIVLCILLIKMGVGIHKVKLATALIFLARPICQRIYVNHHYKINRRIKYSEEPLKQKWNGIAQHVSVVVLQGTDIIVLTTLSTLTDVSIYSVYYMIVHSVEQLFFSLTAGIQSLLGELWAKQEKQKLNKAFVWSEWSIHTGSLFVFGCTFMLILSFVQIYTEGIGDANYYVPIFARLITLAYFIYSLSLPYNIMILASNHYKQTQKYFVIAATLNVTISILTVKLWGLIGVTIGTLVAMTYQMIWMAIYTTKYLVCRPFRKLLKQIGVDIITFTLACFISSYFKLESLNYLSWLIMAFKVALVWCIIITVINVLFYKKQFYQLISPVTKMIHRTKAKNT